MRLIKLCKGKGNGVDKACLMTAANMLIGRGEDLDENSCVCPVLRKWIIHTNDYMPLHLLRELYGPLVFEILGTVTDEESQRRRAHHFLKGVYERMVTPLRYIGPYRLPEPKSFEEFCDLLQIPSVRQDFLDADCGVRYLLARAAITNVKFVVYRTHDAVRIVEYLLNTPGISEESRRHLCTTARDLLVEAIAIGDKRPKERPTTVMTMDELANKLLTV